MTRKSEALRAAKLFEFYVRTIWPWHRLFAKNKISRRCLNCAGSEEMISLNSKKICQLCEKNLTPVSFSRLQESNPRKTKETSELNEILQSYQGVGKNDYDALVLFSGGKDSTYMIRRIQNEYPGLRLLSFTIDNGFMSVVAKENIAGLIPRLGIDHVFVTPKKSFYIKLFRYAITHLNSQGSYGTVDFSDGEFMLDSARKLAFEKKIPLILCGYSKYQVQNGLHLESFESPRARELSDRTETAGILLKDIFSQEEIKMWWHGSHLDSLSVARLLFPLYAWDLEEDQIKNEVVQWGLMNPQKQSPIVTNHQLIPLLGVVDIHKLGFGSFEFEFCRMIREGKAQKSDWQPIFEFLEYTAQTGLFVKPTVLQSLQELNLQLTDVGIEFNRKNPEI